MYTLGKKFAETAGEWEDLHPKEATPSELGQISTTHSTKHLGSQLQCCAFIISRRLSRKKHMHY